MVQDAGPYRHELPRRKVYAVPSEFTPWHHPKELRKIADEFKLRKRRQFYDHAYKLAYQYRTDMLIEEDLLCSAEAKRVFVRAVKHSLQLNSILKELFSRRPLFSLWNESYFTCEGGFAECASGFKLSEFPDQVAEFMILTLHALLRLPSPPPGRKKMLALRKWVAGHVNFWADELGRPITVINDQSDGYSPCHMFLRALLAQIDPDALGNLSTILRERKAELRGKSASN